MFCLICEQYINRFINNQICLKCSLRGTEFIRKFNSNISNKKSVTTTFNLF